MKTHTQILIRKGFTLMETVIAIGVVAILVTGFIAVFAPAVDGIRRSISAEEANRLASTLERELVTLRPGQQPEPGPGTTGFTKAFEWIRGSNDASNVILIYQYRGSPSIPRPIDNTPTPVPQANGVPGKDFITVSMVRKATDTLLPEDLQALEGRVLVVRCTQLVYDDGALVRGVSGVIRNPNVVGEIAATADAYPEAVLTFTAEFFSLPGRSPEYLQSAAFSDFVSTRMNRPMFTRNLAVRR